MKIALLGYGKMGKVIERIALERGHEIVLKKGRTSNYEGLEKADVAIDFSIPDSAVCNIKQCFDTNIPVVCGTTGWLEHYDEMVSLCASKNGSFIYGSNFSLGVNIFFELNNYLAKMMSKFNQYKVSMQEIHHTQKLDAPSGTAISLAKGIIENSDYLNWTLENPAKNEVHIDAKRVENVPGTHSVFYDSDVDQIEIKHTAHNREGFALGAVIAAEWLANKKGVFTMKDVLSLNDK
ncbi:4-hydroxy-tetrahydrodipicolinate reductase [Flavobacterium psychrophilum]|uniref:4-hydroxy-tetrahydrodipicolinate reductase n=1 Tax=Flavobacterium psychrophilum TaxID=96345 RepID=A0A7U2NEF4_FLAPS|nr:4-hydroxy-tetrahydrodipicolinate reductase [Flavobacterium psychrophilum]EKT3963660.1 4-hydroxy-tetrahydrodipicolinate reductase [Flavobacterium psychrophilum]EKT4509446.1 4-hydroxy-tetrahydrodipicolinate reductase [Flavobacterium psychrophilum]EKT4517129.1 4-hydroxy-tetrahydrodipicolinate reductase [Flavobacterium psychrophilum]EKT4545195.1 4-hydroxy-tetrahydrodipicolinate reductase [Flavobacterium psychrophilum]ELY1979175.1 4-hydroxy-tetrahydrodipicolinate reductase [Flavobacterium psychr